MPKLSATKYKLSEARPGVTRITFSDPLNRDFEIEFPTIAIMGLAHALRQRAKGAVVPMANQRLSPTRPLLGPPVKKIDVPSRPVGENGGFDIGVTADLDLVALTFHIPKQGGGTSSATLLLPDEDASVLVSGLQAALDTIRQKPSLTAH